MVSYFFTTYSQPFKIERGVDSKLKDAVSAPITRLYCYCSECWLVLLFAQLNLCLVNLASML